ncbi:hypothetical protein [Streptomyces sp. NBC_00239]|uniref:hypothetical protein n=1 Tax=Streptomyces sp. NBC_00239 TaxID=2903640 RepID=UPI002E28DE32|nr:hypothetical protein [Streptomyces sp. NBC_00239]
MVIALLVFAVAALLVAVTPGAVLGYFFVVTTGRLPLWARVLLLPAVGAGAAAIWLGVLGSDSTWRPAMMFLSFTAALFSGVTFLVRESRQRRTPRLPAAAWPQWNPPSTPR